jgi:hypothetical protein
MIKNPITVARHTAERISSQTVLFALMVLFQALLGIDAGISNIIQKLFLELPNSRTQELEGPFCFIIRFLTSPQTSPRKQRIR